MTEEKTSSSEEGRPLTTSDEQPGSCYAIRFRPGEPHHSAVSRIGNLKKDEVVMAQTDHGLEPAVICGEHHPCPCRKAMEERASYLLSRRANREEAGKYQRLIQREKEAFAICQRLIAKHHLPMNLVRVEQFFNGSKIIFYFTAEHRVDFRELVKDLVQEFRTRVEIRQIGVRHETKMLGGLGCCGRELCCSSFIKTFSPVSIKMAKAQGLPLNPAKISGICNRLLCCLTYEFETYHQIRKHMPKVGKTIQLDGVTYKVQRNNVLEETIQVAPLESLDQSQLLDRDDWQRATLVSPPKKPRQGNRKGQPARAGHRKPKKEPKKQKA